MLIFFSCFPPLVITIILRANLWGNNKLDLLMLERVTHPCFAPPSRLLEKKKNTTEGPCNGLR